MTAIAVIQNMWSKCPKCNQPLTGEMRIGLAEAWWSQVCDQEEKDPVGYMGAVVNLTVTLAMLKEDPERREQYQLFLSKAHACLKKYGKPDRPRDSAQALNIQEEPEMCRAFFTILAWHRHGDHTSFGIMMQDLGKDLRGDPRLDKLGLQLLSMGENATPSQLRSLTMSNATEDLGGNVISAKDLLTVSNIMKKIDKALSGLNDLGVGEGLWEIALKLRIQASEAVEAGCNTFVFRRWSTFIFIRLSGCITFIFIRLSFAVAVGCLPKMAAFLSAQPHGGWSRIAKCSDSSTFAKLKVHPSEGKYKAIGEGDDFFDCIRLAEMAGSVLHEICRYRSGE
jgi:hypothetical protein